MAPASFLARGCNVAVWGLTFKADVDEESLLVQSWVPVYPGADWHERECWEMFGFVFDGHPALRHLYLPSEFEGHPLRKDYPAQKTQPLVPYRTEEDAGLPLGKLSPFRDDEGMSFGRKDWVPERERS